MFMNGTKSRVLGIVVSASAFLAACAGAEEPAAGGGTTTGGEAASYQGAVASTDTARGQQVYEAQCAGCHTADGDDDAYGPAVAGIGWDPAAMRRQIREGEGRMPAFGEDKISADDLEALLAYLVSVGGVAGSAAGGVGAQ